MAVFVDAEAFIVGFHFANHARVAIHFLKKKKSSFKIVLFNYWQKSFNLFWQYCQRKLSAHWSKIRIFVHLLDLDQIVKFLRSILYWFFLSFFSIFFFAIFGQKLDFCQCVFCTSAAKNSPLPIPKSRSPIKDSNMAMFHSDVPGSKCLRWLGVIHSANLDLSICSSFAASCLLIA